MELWSRIKNKKFNAITVIRIVVVSIILLVLAFFSGTFAPNKWTSERIYNELELKLVAEWNEFGFKMPSITYKNNVEFVMEVNRCINFINLSVPHWKRVHRDIIIAMAILETDYGNSRFAKEANNLFGIRTWDPNTPQLKPQLLPNAKFGVRKFATKCHSVQEMVRLINEHPAYAEYRMIRVEQQQSGKENLSAQIQGLQKWSTNPEYTDLVVRTMNEIEEVIGKQTLLEKNK